MRSLAKRETKREAVIRLYQENKTPAEISRALDMQLAYVYATASRARAEGRLPPVRYLVRRTKHAAGMKLLRYRCRKLEGGRRIGSLTEAINGLTPAVIKWLAAITPEGQPVSLTVQSILVDAYHEENDK